MSADRLDAPNSELPAVRRSRVVAFVESVAQAGVHEIAEQFDVSPDTIRRDLTALDADGRLTRTRGGAIANSVLNSPDRELRVRKRLQEVEKATIGRIAAGLISDGAVVALNGGTTTLAVARSLGDRRDLTVATTSLSIPFEIPAHAVRNLYVFGGDVRLSSQVTIGSPVHPDDAVLDRVHFNVAVIGVGGVTEDGYSVSNLGEAASIARMIRRADTCIVVADATKYHRSQFAFLAPLGDAHHFVSDSPPPPTIGQALLRSGVQLHTEETVTNDV